MVADFFTFTWAAVANLVTLMSGMVALAIEGIRRWKKMEVPNHWYAYLIVACLFLGAFQAWREEHHKVVNLSAKPSQISNEQIEKFLEKTFVREIVTQVHENTLLLPYDPIPASVHLIVNGITYVAETTPGMRVEGRKIILEDIAGNVPLLKIAREDAPKGGIVVEYRRAFPYD